MIWVTRLVQGSETNKLPGYMETFNFYLDTKVTTWYRTSFEIEAESLEEAKGLAIKFVEDDNQANIPWDHIDGTVENMRVEDNGGEPTDELYHAPDFAVCDLIWDNGKK